ncbi:TIGR01777 family oxidoreductase, partial [candidate division KSB1 bacterium]|nr:TIGR01777 family oxidoreductase [candidate division KSB1 bacterium]
SAIGYYGPHGDEVITEKDSVGNDFLSQTTKQWEDAAKKVESHGVRLVIMRNGLVLERGGVLEKFLLPFRLFAGGPLGSGKQWFSWIHRDDVIGLILFALENKNVKGVINATAPEPLTMKDFCSTLGKVMGRPSWAPAPSFVLKLALGEMSMLVLTGQRVLPAAAEKAGYKFKFKKAEDALVAILRKKQ